MEGGGEALIVESQDAVDGSSMLACACSCVHGVHKEVSICRSTGALPNIHKVGILEYLRRGASNPGKARFLHLVSSIKCGIYGGRAENSYPWTGVATGTYLPTCTDSYCDLTLNLCSGVHKAGNLRLAHGRLPT